MTSGIPEVVPRALRGDPQSLCACSPGHCAGQGSGWGALAERGALAGHGVLGGLLSSGGASGTAAEAPAQVGRWVFQSHPGASGPHTASPSRVPRSLGTPGGGGRSAPQGPRGPFPQGGAWLGAWPHVTVSEDQRLEAGRDPRVRPWPTRCPGVQAASAGNVPDLGLAVPAADVDAFNLLLEMKLKRRRERPDLPRTVTELVAEDGSRVYVVGTAHFSDDSKKDVVKVRPSPGRDLGLGPTSSCAFSPAGRAGLFCNFPCRSSAV